MEARVAANALASTPRRWLLLFRQTGRNQGLHTLAKFIALILRILRRVDRLAVADHHFARMYRPIPLAHQALRPCQRHRHHPRVCTYRHQKSSSLEWEQTAVAAARPFRKHAER